jgi:4-amino-4-deoxy-L-arabinose transferase-like glycosyltransferase
MTVEVERGGSTPVGAPFSRVRTLLRGRPEDPAWVRPTLLGLVVTTAVLYLWGLGASGWANAYYSAAAQAAGGSWKAWFFGSTDAMNSITIDKPPATMWAMGLSVRIFGLSSWSVLVPQALMGLASVGLLYATVRRTSGYVAGLLAGGALALSPVAALIFRYNNPDALLVLLLIAAAYCVVRALEKASPQWLALAGAAVGFGFLTKMLQAFLVLPAFALAYLIAAPTSTGKRLLHLLGGLGAVIVSAGWYIAVVELWPASSRPYIGGSQTNSILELTFGYNGLRRMTGYEVNGSTGTQTGSGWSRLFDSEMGGGIAWLIPAALIAIAAVFYLTRRAPRTDPTRAATILWGGWLIVTGGVFSFMNGTIHPYYVVALAPAIAALAGIGATRLWRSRRDPIAVSLLAGGVALTAFMSYTLLERQSGWMTWLGPTVLVIGLGAAVLVLAANRLPGKARRAVAVLALVAALGGTGAYTAATVATTHSGAVPSAGPNSGFGGRGGTGSRPGGGNRSFAGQGQGGPQGGAGGGSGRGNTAGVRSLITNTTPSAALVALLQDNASAYTWVAATVGSMPAAGYQLTAGSPVMAIGGYNGTDPSPTLTEFQQLVHNGEIHYFIGEATTIKGTAGIVAAEQIFEWISQNYTATTVNGTNVYNLTT